MSGVVSADSLQLAHVQETSPGVTPATPVFNLWRTSGESVVFAPNTSDSTELGGDGRTQKPSNVTGTSVSGDINFELAKFPALEEAIAGVMAAVWGECPLTGAAGGAIDSANRITVGDDLPTFTIEKRFPNPNNTSGTMDLSASAGAPGATVDITITGTTAVGSGVIEVSIAQDGNPADVFSSPITPGDDADAAATALAAVIDADANWGASAVAGVVTVTPIGTTVSSVAAAAGKDEYYYQRYRGCSYSVMNLTTAPNETVTGSFSVVGGAPELSSLPVAGATYNTAGSGAVFTAPEVLAINLGPSIGVLTSCFNSLTINLDSQNRGIPCIGTSGDREVVTGLLLATVSGEVYFTNQLALESMLANEVIGDGDIVFSNADDDVYRFDFFGLKVTSGQVAAGGTGQDVTVPLEFQPTPVEVCDDGGSIWTSGLIVSLVNTAPTLP